MSDKPTAIEEVELWKLRATGAERRAITAEVQNAQRHLETLNKDFDEFIKGLQSKYGPAQIREDGVLVYPEETPKTEPEVEDAV